MIQTHSFLHGAHQQYNNQTTAAVAEDMSASTTRKRIRPQSLSSSSSSSLASAGLLMPLPGPLTEYRQQFRASGFRPATAGDLITSRGRTAGAGGRPDSHNSHSRRRRRLVTRSATRSDLRASPPNTASAARKGSRLTEYTSNYKNFDDYVYVNDRQGFVVQSSCRQRRRDDGEDTGDVCDGSGGAAGGGSRSSSVPPLPADPTATSWLDQVKERHSQAARWARRSHAGIDCISSSSLMNAKENFPCSNNNDRQCRSASAALIKDVRQGLSVALSQARTRLAQKKTTSPAVVPVLQQQSSGNRSNNNNNKKSVVRGGHPAAAQMEAEAPPSSATTATAGEKRHFSLNKTSAEAGGQNLGSAEHRPGFPPLKDSHEPYSATEGSDSPHEKRHFSSSPVPADDADGDDEKHADEDVADEVDGRC